MQESEYPLVSICMPVYNGARFLPYTIDNILAQSYRNIELIIVDDGSIDDSLQALLAGRRVPYSRVSAI